MESALKPSDIVIRPAELDDWEAIKQLVSFLQSWQDKFDKPILAASKESMEVALVNSRTTNVPIRLLLAFEDGVLKGFALMVIVQGPDLSRPGFAVAYQCFIHSAFIIPGTNPEVGDELMAGIENYARAHNSNLVYGHVRDGGPLKGFFRRYGLKKGHEIWSMSMIGKEL